MVSMTKDGADRVAIEALVAMIGPYTNITSGVTRCCVSGIWSGRVRRTIIDLDNCPIQLLRVDLGASLLGWSKTIIPTYSRSTHICTVL